MESRTERTFSFTVTLPHAPYAELLVESRKREKQPIAVPSRTARQLIIERLIEIKNPAGVGTPGTALGVMGVAEEETKPVASKKPRSSKRGVGENGRPPTRGVE